MAIYTAIADDTLNPWLAELVLGKVEALIGIHEGIENSNYYLRTSHPHTETATQDFVLTVFERTTPEHFAFYLAWLKHLYQGGLAVPYPVACHTLLGKPALIATRLWGKKVMQPTPEHCACVGTWLAQLHLRGAPSQPIPTQPRPIAWQKTLLPTLQGRIAPSDWELAKHASESIWPAIATMQLPRGAIHADLFRDNLLFNDDQHISGVFDFFFGGEDHWLYDVAVSINDWCANVDETLSPPHTQALLQGYQRVRRLTEAEEHALPTFLQAAALRFFLSRLADVAYPREGTLTAHDPARFAAILRDRLSPQSLLR